MVANFAESLELNYQKMKELEQSPKKKPSYQRLKKLKQHHRTTRDNHIKKIERDSIYDKAAHHESDY